MPRGRTLAGALAAVTAAVAGSLALALAPGAPEVTTAAATLAAPGDTTTATSTTTVTTSPLPTTTSPVPTTTTPPPGPPVEVVVALRPGLCARVSVTRDPQQRPVLTVLAYVPCPVRPRPVQPGERVVTPAPTPAPTKAHLPVTG
jgi:hypothetical protein